jgi:hypothetical protein
VGASGGRSDFRDAEVTRLGGGELRNSPDCGQLGAQ